MKFIFLKVSFAFLLISLLCFKADAQTLIADSLAAKVKTDSLLIDSLKKVRAKAVYFEAGGVGLSFSLNYDTRFGKRRDGFGMRIGAGYVQFANKGDSYAPDPYNSRYHISYLTIPAQINYLLGKRKHFVELGAGSTFTVFDGGRSSNVLFPVAKPGKQSKFINTLTVGYRNQPLAGGLTVRANVDVFYTAIFVMPTVGLSLGYTFKDKHFKAKAVKQVVNKQDASLNKAATDTIAKKVKRAKSVYAELFGPGLLFSGNYDFRFARKRDGLGARIGFGFLSHDERRMISFPVQINYLIGKGSDFFEIGLGASYLKVNYQDVTTMPNYRPKYFGFGPGSVLIGTTTFGYRYQPVDGNFSFRASLNPLFNDKLFTPSGGVSIGYLF